MTPPLSDLPPEPPTLMAFLNSSSNFTLFRSYLLVSGFVSGSLSVRVCVLLPVCVCVFQTYNLTNDLASPDFTLLLPTDDAVRRFLSRNSSGLVGSTWF